MKRVFAVLSSLTLALGIAAAPACAQAGAASKWVNADIIGAVTADTPANLKDDFNLYVNKDWCLNAEISPTRGEASGFIEIKDKARAQMAELVSGAEQTSHEGRILQQYYRDFIDMNTRNRLGIEPLLQYLEPIEAITTLEELEAYMTGTNRLDRGLMSTIIATDSKDSTRRAVLIRSPFLTLEELSEYETLTPVGQRRKEASCELYTKLLLRCGYTQEAIEYILDELFRIEYEIADSCISVSKIGLAAYISGIYNPVTISELEELSPIFPAAGLLKQYTDVGVSRFILEEPKWLQKMNELYTPENLDAFKALLICDTLRNCCQMLDQQCVDLYDEYKSYVEGASIKSNASDSAFNSIDLMLGMALGKLYVENYVPESIKQGVTQIVHEAVDVYKKRLTNIDWLSEGVRSKAIEKMENMRLRIAYPDDWTPYELTGLTLTPMDQGGSLPKHYIEIRNFTAKQQLDSIFKPVDKSEWPSIMPPQSVNAQYNVSDNSINILAGILSGDYYDPDASEAANLAGIGVVIGHEITHGFDILGSQFDQDGNLSDWWTPEDTAVFMERTQKVADYYSTMEVLPGVYVDGDFTVGETVADLGGISCMLEIAKTRENFDYETFFTHYARLWRCQNSPEQEQAQLKDVHVPGFLRANVNVQQFEEFYETFGISPQDGMYLAPEDRLSVW